MSVSHAVSCPFVSILFYDFGRQAGVLKRLKMLNFKYFLAVRVLFNQVFSQVRKWLLLKLHEMIKVLHIVASPIVFIFFCYRARHARLLKLMKNDTI